MEDLETGACAFEEVYSWQDDWWTSKTGDEHVERTKSSSMII